MNFFSSLPEDINNVVFSYIPIIKCLQICTVSRQFKTMATNIDDPLIQRALDTITGWWFDGKTNDRIRALPIDECLQQLEIEAFLGSTPDKSLYLRIGRLFYINPSMKISWNEVLTLVERYNDLEVYGRTNHFYTRLLDLSKKLKPWRHIFDDPVSSFDELTEYYDEHFDEAMLQSLSHRTLPLWKDQVNVFFSGNCFNAET